jgi:hypothetical protein
LQKLRLLHRANINFILISEQFNFVARYLSLITDPGVPEFKDSDET